MVIRFSSIGDIVLTTPVIRCLKQQLPCELHFVTKRAFKDTLVHNPYIDKLHTFDKEVDELFEQLKAEKFDIVIDLHRNLRSLRLKRKLGAKSYSFDKINLRKFAAVNFKMLKALPDKHIVERYLETVFPLGVKDDNEGLDYFISDADTTEIPQEKYIALVVGGSYFTKKIPLVKLEQICSEAKLPIVIVGSSEDKFIGDELEKKFPGVMNTCGKCSINQSAYIVKNAALVITSDTGLMHIAAAYKKPIVSVWGNTIPEFGMGPYKPNPENKILEVKNLECRPCSKLGFKKCPKGHFKCMMEIDVSGISS